MNEYTLNIPINDYEKLKICELRMQKYYNKKLFELIEDYYKDSSEESIRTHDGYHRYNKSRSMLRRFLDSKHYEFFYIEND